mgnify:CR=1 FL=1
MVLVTLATGAATYAVYTTSLEGRAAGGSRQALQVQYMAEASIQSVAAYIRSLGGADTFRMLLVEKQTNQTAGDGDNSVDLNGVQVANPALSSDAYTWLTPTQISSGLLVSEAIHVSQPLARKENQSSDGAALGDRFVGDSAILVEGHVNRAGAGNSLDTRAWYGTVSTYTRLRHRESTTGPTSVARAFLYGELPPASNSEQR